MDGPAGKHVLLVEDEPLVRVLMEDMLLRLGCARVRCATDAASALAALQAERPDIVLLDLCLDGTPSFDVAEHIEAMGLPFLFITGASRKCMLDRWERRVMLAKPFSIDALAQAIRQVA